MILLYTVSVLPQLAFSSTVTSLAMGMKDDVLSFYRMIGALAMLCGLGFLVAALFKFKQFKDNPQQTPVGTPFVLLFIGILLAFLPSFILPAGQTLFGSSTLTPSKGILDAIPS